MNNTLQIPRTVTINVRCNGSQTQPLGNQSVLDKKKVLAVLTRLAPAAGTIKTSNGVELAPGQESCYLRLVNGQNEVIHDGLPLRLLDVSAGSSNVLLQLDSSAIDWTKSALVWGDAALATAATGKEVPLIVVYQ